MYYCKKCGNLFESCSTNYERHGDNYQACEVWQVCPKCGSAGFEEARECESCGEFFGEEELRLYDICECCQREIKNKSVLLLKTEFNKSEIQFIYEEITDIFERAMDDEQSI